MKYEVDLIVLRKLAHKTCPCVIPSQATTVDICPCVSFLESGTCRCKLFKKVEENENT